MNEQCPIQYVTYNQNNHGGTSEDDEGGFYDWTQPDKAVCQKGGGAKSIRLTG